MKPIFGPIKTGRFKAILAACLLAAAATITIAQLPHVLVDSSPSGRARSAVKASLAGNDAEIEVDRVLFPEGSILENPQAWNVNLMSGDVITTPTRWRLISNRNVGAVANLSYFCLSTPNSAGTLVDALRFTTFCADATPGAERFSVAIGAMDGGTIPEQIVIGQDIVYVPSIAVGAALGGVPQTVALGGSAAHDFNCAALSVEEFTVAVTGALKGDVVDVEIPDGGEPTNGAYRAYVSPDGTVNVGYVNNSATTAFNPASLTYKVLCRRYSH